MATASTTQLCDSKFHYWIKTGMAIVYTKEGLQEIVTNEMSQFQQKVYNDIFRNKGMSHNTSCNSCNTESIMKCTPKNKICVWKRRKCIVSHRPCPLGICEGVRDEIIKAHRFSGPSWRNTDARQWANSPWEFAKCFMPPEGYSSVSTAAETDFNGIISVFLNYEHFQIKVNENLCNPANIFSNARDVGKNYRHCPGFEISKKEFEDSITILTDVLSDSKHIAGDSNAQIALQRLTQLGSGTWTITDKDISKHLQDAINEARNDIDKTKSELLEEAQRFISTSKKENVATTLSSIQNIFSRYKEKIKKTVQHGIKRIRRESDTASKKLKAEMSEDYDFQTKELRQRLVQTYKSNCVTLPISPLLEEEELPLLTFYVKPYMRRLEHHKIQKDEISVDLYRHIFYKGGQQCRNIYITGDAGIGKTALCQRMALLWCLAKAQSALDTDDESVQEDASMMDQFDFLFYISLRDTTFCRIDDIIMHQLLGMLENKEVLLKILNKEKCLIILDGLDEWTHPTETKQCPSNLKIPHRQDLENCVYLTTSRPYKLECLRLGTHEIDQQIEILAMEEGVGFTFVELLIEHLNDKCNGSKDPVTFLENVAENKLDDLLNIPLITTHLICLWFDGKLRMMSLSEVYGNTLEMMFQRAFERKSRSKTMEAPVRAEQHEIKTPKCLSNLKHVQSHISVLYKLCYLAFEALFTDLESSLVFSNSDLDEYGLPEDAIIYLCSVGILSKNKAIGYLTERKHTLSFPHKLYQEFMAALYIAMTDKKDDIRSKIAKACKTLAEVKKFSDVFIFLASLAPYAVEALFQEVNAALSKDKAVSDFREFSCSAMFNFISQRRKQVENKVKSVQDLAVKCFEECKRSGGKDIAVKLEDVFIYKNNATQIQNMLRSSKSAIKSIFTTGSYLDEEMCSIAGLVRLEIRFIKSDEDFQKYSKLMCASALILKNLSISYCSEISEMPLDRLNHLTSIYFHNVEIKHDHLKELIEFISKKHDLSQIGLDAVQCEDHGYGCTHGRFDIQHHEKLYLLGIGGVNFEAVYVNRSELFRLNLDYKKTVEAACWAKPLLKDLMFAPVLKKLVVSNIKDNDVVEALVKLISSLQNLKYLYLLNIDFFENLLWLDPEGKEIDIEMSHVTFTDECFRCFIDSVKETKKIVYVNLLFYTITKTQRDAFSYIKSSPRLHVLRNTDFSLKFRTMSLK
ncbi:uncharacterized protein LOC123533778 [Mercenaria mercenaria]|uniref:uncharacterized protein LOC123533778 n=1 Tax=Mercenaria mercenaria TaxID=6596 RepID=UPI00234F309E|nr:uncharacterized protein LOC123533778 [Mercenaria mercenaria]